MNAIDFTTALARLLSDPLLRNEFRSNPASATQRLGVRAEDFAAIAEIDADELEVQARILLRKRLDAIRSIIPRTCAALGENLWPRFEQYATKHAPDRDQNAVGDAFHFCVHLAGVDPGAASASELNRLRFALGKRRLALHLVNDFVRRGGLRTAAVQVFVRTDRKRWREWAFFFSLEGVRQSQTAAIAD